MIESKFFKFNLLLPALLLPLLWLRSSGRSCCRFGENWGITLFLFLFYFVLPTMFFSEISVDVVVNLVK